MTATWKTALLVVLSLGGVVAALPNEARAFDPRTVGARVTGVALNSPASRAGIEVGDVIVAIDGLPVRSTDDFAQLTACKRRVTLTIRDGRSGTYVFTDCAVVNGRIGVRFVIVVVPAPVGIPYGADAR